MYGYPASGYVMSAGGAPVAIPMQAMQAGASGAAAQGYHQPMVLMPVSGAAGGQQLIAHQLISKNSVRSRLCRIHRYSD